MIVYTIIQQNTIAIFSILFAKCIYIINKYDISIFSVICLNGNKFSNFLKNLMQILEILK